MGGRGVGLGQVLGEDVGEVNGGGIVLGIGIAGGEDIADEVEGFGGGGVADEVGLILGDIGEGALMDIGHLEMGGSGLEEWGDGGGGTLGSGKADENEVCFIALEGEADDFVGVAGASVEEEDGGLVGEIGEGIFEGDEGADFIAQDAFDDILEKGGWLVGGDEGGGIGVEVEEGLIGIVGDAGDEAILGGGGAGEGGGGGGEGKGDAGDGVGEQGGLLFGLAGAGGGEGEGEGDSEGEGKRVTEEGRGGRIKIQYPMSNVQYPISKGAEGSKT